MGVINKRLKFMAKYGTADHRAMLSKHIDSILDDRYDHMRDRVHVASQIAIDSDISLTSDQVHKIIGTKNPTSLYMTHPMLFLPKYHFGAMQDEHWDHVVKTATDNDLVGMMEHMPSKYRAKIAKRNVTDVYRYRYQ